MLPGWFAQWPFFTPACASTTTNSTAIEWPSTAPPELLRPPRRHDRRVEPRFLAALLARAYANFFFEAGLRAQACPRWCRAALRLALRRLRPLRLASGAASTCSPSTAAPTRTTSRGRRRSPARAAAATTAAAGRTAPPRPRARRRGRRRDRRRVGRRRQHRRDRRRHQRERGARRAAKLRGAHSRGRGRSSCHTVCSCAHAVLNRMCAVGCTEYVEVATAIRVDSATLGAAGARQPRPRLPKSTAAPRSASSTPRAARRRRRLYDPALARHTDALEVSAAELRFGAEMGYTWWRWLLLAAARRRLSPAASPPSPPPPPSAAGGSPQHRARDRRRRSQPRRGGAAGAPVATAARCAAGAGVALPRRACTRPSTRRRRRCAGAWLGRRGGPGGGAPVAGDQWRWRPVDGGGLSVAERYRTGRRRVPYGAEVRE